MKNNFKIQVLQGKEVIYESEPIDNSKKEFYEKKFMEIINSCYDKGAASCVSWTMTDKIIIIPRNILMNCIVQLVPIENEPKPPATKPSSGGQTIP